MSPIDRFKPFSAERDFSLTASNPAGRTRRSITEQNVEIRDQGTAAEVASPAPATGQTSAPGWPERRGTVCVSPWVSPWVSPCFQNSPALSRTFPDHCSPCPPEQHLPKATSPVLGSQQERRKCSYLILPSQIALCRGTMVTGAGMHRRIHPWIRGGSQAPPSPPEGNLTVLSAGSHRAVLIPNPWVPDRVPSPPCAGTPGSPLWGGTLSWTQLLPLQSLAQLTFLSLAAPRGEAGEAWAGAGRGAGDTYAAPSSPSPGSGSWGTGPAASPLC